MNIANHKISSNVTIEQWKNAMPDVDSARPSQCIRCQVPRGPLGALNIHGHGVVTRSCLGPLTPEQDSGWGVLTLRRYLCKPCRCVMRVGPTGLVYKKLFHGAAISLALAFLLAGATHHAIRKRIRPGRSREGTGRWRSLTRWKNAAMAGRLWDCVKGDSLTDALAQIAARAQSAFGDFTTQCFMGAAHMP